MTRSRQPLQLRPYPGRVRPDRSLRIGGPDASATFDELASFVRALAREVGRAEARSNKAIYRTRLAMADGGELVVVAPGLERFGEDPLVDTLIRRHGYHGREAALQAMAGDPELSANLAAVAHLIHGSTEARFTVTYAPGPGVSRAEIEGVDFRYLPLDAALAEKIDIPNPGLGLWRI